MSEGVGHLLFLDGSFGRGTRPSGQHYGRFEFWQVFRQQVEASGDIVAGHGALDRWLKVACGQGEGWVERG